jgi:hypothetical protein
MCKRGAEEVVRRRNSTVCWSGLERRLDELGRKHCDRQPGLTISLPVPHTKSGAKAVLFRFRQMIKAATAANALPDYIRAYGTLSRSAQASDSPIRKGAAYNSI